MSDGAIIVTGSASGIGRACTAMLLERGARVAAFDIQSEKLEAEFPGEIKNLLKISGNVANTADCQTAVKATLDKFGALDALIHWGAAHSSATWDELDAEECTRTL